MQTNPHFLFNAINTIYIQIDDSKETAKHTLSTFSDMLRYQLYECNSEKVPIEKEIQYIRNYIELQRLRMDESYRIDFNYAAGLSGFQVAPFILLPFIENMFKHISNGLSPNIIRGELSSVNGALRFKGCNTKSKSTGNEINGGIGLANVRRRLDLIYPGKYSLDISDTESTYAVCLQIQLV
jgi:LytS/YehU family sensor histidine kinase